MNLMRKNFALALVALLSLTMALAAVSCAPKAAEETPAATTPETMPPADNMMVDSTMMDSTGMMADTTTMQH